PYTTLFRSSPVFTNRQFGQERFTLSVRSVGGASGPAVGRCGSIMQRVRIENWRLRWERQRRGWSQDDVVDRLQDVAAKRAEPEPGVDRNTVSRWERGISRPTPRYVQLLAA